jgi:hypothetical protein
MVFSDDKASLRAVAKFGAQESILHKADHG